MEFSVYSNQKMPEPRVAIINGKKYLLYVKQNSENKSSLRLCSKEAQNQREERRALADVKKLVCPKLRKPTEEKVLSRVYNRLVYLEKLYANLTMAEIEEAVLSKNEVDVMKPPKKRMKITEIPVNEALNLLKQSGITVNSIQ